MEEQIKELVVEHSVDLTRDADTQEADSTKIGGKYASTEELWRAYQLLQADYTRKCQELKSQTNESQASVAANPALQMDIPALIGKGASVQATVDGRRSLRDSDILARTFFKEVL